MTHAFIKSIGRLNSGLTYHKWIFRLQFRLIIKNTWRLDKVPTDACLHKILELSFCLFVFSFVGYCLLGIEGINKTLVVRIARISEKMGVVTNWYTSGDLFPDWSILFAFTPIYRGFKNADIQYSYGIWILWKDQWLGDWNYFIKSVSVFTCVQGCQN